MLDLVTVAGIAFKTGIVVVAAGLLSLALRRQPAAFNHALWTAALTLCVFLPLAVFLLPANEVIALPSAPTLPLRHARETEWKEAVVTLWMSGVACVLLLDLLSRIGLARWRRDASSLTSPRWSATLARIGFDHRRLRVLESQHITSPCTWGLVRPVLLLPTSGDTWPESSRRAALLHELAHVERRDALSTLIARLACALYWYNPLIWIAAERIRSLQERACDDVVLRAGATPSDYAQFLLEVAAHTSGVTRLARASIGMTHGSSLRERVVAILDPEASRSRPRQIRVAAACVSLFVFTIPLATITVAVEPPPVTPATSIPAIPAIPAIAPIPPIPPIPSADPTP